MKQIPPHLPKKEKTTSGAGNHHSVFYFLSAAFISIAASLSTVFVALSWIVPRAVPQVQFYNFPHETAQKIDTTVDSNVLNHIMERQVSLYDRRTILPNSWYPADSALATGVFLTSDGWVVFPLGTTVVDKTLLASLEVVDNRGAVFGVQNPLLDKNLHLLYAKINGDGFRFASFPAPDALKLSAHVVEKKNGVYALNSLTISQKNPLFNPNSEIWQPAYLFSSAQSATAPGLVFTEQGELLGVNSAAGIIPGLYIEQTLTSLLSKHLLSYNAFPWVGQMVDQGIQNGFVKNTTGFFITDLGGDKTKNGMKGGDVITKIAGTEVTRSNVAELIFHSPDMVSFDIIRDGLTIQKTLPKQIISF